MHQQASFVGLAGARGGAYSLTADLDNDADERLFRQFSRSFRLLHLAPTFPPLTIGFIVVDGTLLTLACWGAIALLGRSPRSQLLTPLSGLGGIMVTLYAGVVALGVVTGGRTPDDLDYALRQIAAPCFLLAAGAAIAWLAGRHARAGPMGTGARWAR